jgi:hypothetical protein
VRRLVPIPTTLNGMGKAGTPTTTTTTTTTTTAATTTGGGGSSGSSSSSSSSSSSDDTNKQSNPYTDTDRPLGRQVEVHRIFRQSAHEGAKVVSPTHRPPLPPFVLEAESTPGP